MFLFGLRVERPAVVPRLLLFDFFSSCYTRRGCVIDAEVFLNTGLVEIVKRVLLLELRKFDESIVSYLNA